MTRKGRLLFFHDFSPFFYLVLIAAPPYFERIESSVGLCETATQFSADKGPRGLYFDKQMAAGNTVCAFNNGDGDKWSLRKVVNFVFQGPGRYSPCYRPLVSGVDTK
jgi:hypothetical protein